MPLEPFHNAHQNYSTYNMFLQTYVSACGVVGSVKHLFDCCAG